jgi:hypothetical protein
VGSKGKQTGKKPAIILFEHQEYDTIIMVIMMTKKMATSVTVFLIALALSTTVSTGFISPPPSDRIRNKVAVTTIITGGGSSSSSSSSSNNIISSSSRLYASTTPSRNKIAVIDSWKLLPDGRIKGVISPDGDNVLTSPLKNPKRSLKEKATIRTVSGSRYSLGTPADATTTSTDKNTKLRANQLGIPRATLGGGARGGVRATQPLMSSGGARGGARATQHLMSTPTTSQDRVLQSYLANKGRATMPLANEGRATMPLSSSSSSSSSPDSMTKTKNGLLTVRNNSYCVHFMLRLYGYMDIWIY